MSFITFIGEQAKVFLKNPEWMLWVFLLLAFIGLWLIRRRANKRKVAEQRLIDRDGYIRSSDMPDISPLVVEARRRAILSVVIVLVILVWLNMSELNEWFWPDL